MEYLFLGIGWIFAIGFLAFFFQIYFWRRKLDRMADEDMKRADREEWKRHVKFSRYTKMISRSFCGAFFIVWAVRYFVLAQNERSIVFIAITTLIGVFFLGRAIYGFRAHGEATGDLQ